MVITNAAMYHVTSVTVPPTDEAEVLMSSSASMRHLEAMGSSQPSVSPRLHGWWGMGTAVASYWELGMEERSVMISGWTFCSGGVGVSSLVILDGEKVFEGIVVVAVAVAAVDVAVAVGVAVAAMVVAGDALTLAAFFFFDLVDLAFFFFFDFVLALELSLATVDVLLDAAFFFFFLAFFFFFFGDALSSSSSSASSAAMNNRVLVVVVDDVDDDGDDDGNGNDNDEDKDGVNIGLVR